jgi:fucose permease
MIMFSSYNSLQNIVAKLYDDDGYNNMGRVLFICLYGMFGVTTVFSSFIVKKFGFKKSMFFASLGYAVFESMGLLIAAKVNMPHALVWVIEIAGAMLCGVCASVIWVAQGAYVGAVADENSKSELFGLFWALMLSSQIFGNLLITFALPKLGEVVYFFILIGIGCNTGCIQF